MNNEQNSRDYDANSSGLTTVLQRSGIDTSTFKAIYEADDEILYAFVTHGDNAIDLWFRLRNISAHTRHWPVVLGVEADLIMLRQAMTSYPADEIPNIIAEGQQMQIDVIVGKDPETDIDAEYLESYLKSEHYKEHQRLREAWHQIRRQGVETKPGMPDGIDPYFFQIPRDYRTDKGYPEVYIALVPTTRSWEVPAYLRFGNWNACPSPAEHVCIQRYWHDLYGSNIVGLSHDIIETLVDRQPTREADALALAFEQYMYCEDIVSQGHGSIKKLANGLKILDNWYFWWD